MEDKLVGLLPFPASTTIDYKEQRISFRYIDPTRYNTKFKIFYRLYMAWLQEMLYATTGLIITFILVKGMLDFFDWAAAGQMETATIPAPILYFILVMFGTPLVLAILHFFTPLGAHLKKVIPKLAEIRHWEKKWIEIKKAQGTKVIVPMFDSIFMDWEAKGEFKDCSKRSKSKSRNSTSDTRATRISISMPCSITRRSRRAAVSS